MLLLHGSAAGFGSLPLMLPLTLLRLLLLLSALTLRPLAESRLVNPRRRAARPRQSRLRILPPEGPQRRIRKRGGRFLIDLIGCREDRRLDESQQSKSNFFLSSREFSASQARS